MIKTTYVFNNVHITSKLRVVKVSPKSNIAIIWIDIWNLPSISWVKSLINRCFNIESHIATIHEANMNLKVSQYKNCWKWKHTTFVYRIQGLKCIKCNGTYKTEHCYMSSPPIWKIHPHGNIAFLISTIQAYLLQWLSSCNTPYSSDATIQIFSLPWWKYSYLTQSSIAESYSC